MIGPKDNLPLKEETTLKLRTWEVKGRRQVELVDADDTTVYFGALAALKSSHDAVLSWVSDALNNSIKSL